MPRAKILHCDRQGGSQEAAAERFLKTHHRKGEVPLITVDIGANDVDGCATGQPSVISCVDSGLNTISHEPAEDPRRPQEGRAEGHHVRRP